MPGGTEKIAGYGLLEGGSVPRLLFREQFIFNPQRALEIHQNHESDFFFIHLVGLEGLLNHPVSKARACCVNVNK